MAREIRLRSFGLFHGVFFQVLNHFPKTGIQPASTGLMQFPYGVPGVFLFLYQKQMCPRNKLLL
jgi:hypothetical protein